MVGCPALRRAVVAWSAALCLSAPALLPPIGGAGADGCRNPAIDRNFPDPDVLAVGGAYFAYATNDGDNVQLVRSRDLDAWRTLPDALPRLPAWAEPGWTWAPEVAARPDGKGYVMYVTARHRPSRDRPCIGVAVSATPEGPFAPVGAEPLICPLEEGGAIDASTFRESDGSLYVLWKTDGNCCGLDARIFIQRTSSDGLRLVGERKELIRQDRPWEWPLVEAPTLWKEGGRYHLFYSANLYHTPRYAIGYAVADRLLGPYEKTSGPLLATTRKPRPIVGPGGQDVVRTRDGRTWLIYHSWPPDFDEDSEPD